MNEPRAHELTGRRRELLEILPGLRRFALSLAGNAAAADDLLHSTIDRVLKRGLPIEADLMPWCIRVCRQTWMDESRARSTHDFGGSNTAAGEGNSAEEASPAAALADLCEEQRAVLELVAVEGRSYRATAAILDVPIGRVMSRVARARGAMVDRCRAERTVPTRRKAACRD